MKGLLGGKLFRITWLKCFLRAFLPERRRGKKNLYFKDPLPFRERCIMTAYDPDTLVKDEEITREIYRRFEGKLALNCFVIEPRRHSVRLDIWTFA